MKKQHTYIIFGIAAAAVTGIVIWLIAKSKAPATKTNTSTTGTGPATVTGTFPIQLGASSPAITAIQQAGANDSNMPQNGMLDAATVKEIQGAVPGFTPPITSQAQLNSIINAVGSAYPD